MRKNFIIIFLFVFYILFSAKPILAATGEGFGCGGGLGPVGEALCNLTSTDTELVGGQFNNIISVFLGFMTISATIWFMFQLITAGYGWLSAGGDKTKTEAAWHKITNSVIGLVIVISSWILIGIIGQVLGLKNILNPGALLQILRQ